jgi:hypothetical protein
MRIEDVLIVAGDRVCCSVDDDGDCTARCSSQSAIRSLWLVFLRHLIRDRNGIIHESPRQKIRHHMCITRRPILAFDFSVERRALILQQIELTASERCRILHVLKYTGVDTFQPLSCFQVDDPLFRITSLTRGYRIGGESL